MERRSVLALPLAALVGAAASRASPEAANPAAPAGPRDAQSDTGMRSALPIAAVAAGTDRGGRKHQIGVSATTYKVVTSDTRGDLFASNKQTSVAAVLRFMSTMAKTNSSMFWTANI